MNDSRLDNAATEMSNDYAMGLTLTDTRLEGMDQTPLIYYPEPFAIVHSELSQHHGSLELHKEGGFVIKQALIITKLSNYYHGTT